MDKLFSSRAVVESRTEETEGRKGSAKQRTRCLLYRDNLPYLPPTYEMAYVLIELVSPNPASHMPREMGADLLRQARHDQSNASSSIFFQLGHLLRASLASYRVQPEASAPGQTFRASSPPLCPPFHSAHDLSPILLKMLLPTPVCAGLASPNTPSRLFHTTPGS
jgi:hypothetical protein